MAELNDTKREERLLEKLSLVSSDPGVYLMKDEGGRIIYVGKAKNLKKRLSSYFVRSTHPDVKTGVLVGKIDSFDTIITATEKEALILESTLITRHKPRYNVILKDDKKYPSLRIDVTETYPALTVVRKIKNDGALYFGPYTSASAIHKTLKFINKTFKLRKCGTKNFCSRTRPCLNYQIGTCLAPCYYDVEPEVYGEIVREVTLFLRGRAPELIGKIKREMGKAAEEQKFEEAADLRDKLFAIQKTLEKQVVVSTDMVDRDVIALVRRAARVILTLFTVRSGFLQGSRHFDFDETISTDEETVESFIRQYYGKNNFVPAEILVSHRSDDVAVTEEWLSARKGRRVHLIRPVRGEKRQLIDMALKNAEKELDERIASDRSDTELILRLMKRLDMDRLPERIECFDNSNISGDEPVAGMVVFVNGQPEKSSYRKFKIKSVEQQDDYAYMEEILKRRYGKGEASEPFPDLLMVDGGKGHLNIAVSVLKELGIYGSFQVIGIAKKDELNGEKLDKIYKPGRSNPIVFGRETDLVFLLQRIRDEVHRFAITYHRKRRGKKFMTSALDAIPGMGKKRKAVLLEHFGGISAIGKASVDDLARLPGMNRAVAAAVLKSFQQ